MSSTHSFRRRRAALLLIILSLSMGVSSCASSGKKAVRDDAGNELSLIEETAHGLFYSPESDDGVRDMIRILSQEFENQEQRITELFNYHSDKKTVIHVYAEVSQFYDVVGRVTEGTYDLDDNTIKIYTPLNLSSPSVRSEYVFQLIHEFVHSVIQQINSKIGQVKWLDEGTAYYASGQLEAELKSPTRHPVFPDFEQVASTSFFDVFNQSAYFYSGTIVKFITDKYGQESLNKVIRNPDHFEELLNVSFQSFYEEWKAWSNHSLLRE